VSGGDVYVAGYNIREDGITELVWENGKPIQFQAASRHASRAMSIFVTGGA